MNGPLAGKRIINTRATHQAAELDTLLRAEGAIPVPFPCIAIEPVADPGPLDAALSAAIRGGYDWVLFTSVNTVRAVTARLNTVGWVSAPCRLAAVGRATGAAVEQALGRTVDVVPEQQDAAGLAAALPISGGESVLIPGSSQARPELAEALHARGAIVTVVTAYHTVPATPRTDLRLLLGTVDAIVFASPSAVTGFANQLTAADLNPEALTGLIVACIGPTTLAAAEAARIPNPLMAAEPSLNGILGLLESVFALRSDQEAIRAQ